MTAKKILIKKYENRRLYDTNNRRYVNLDEIAQMIREGHDIAVVDAVTGEDLTRLILAQIVLENARTPDSVFPTEILRQMIVISGQVTQESALRYTQMMMEMFQNAMRAMPPAMNPFGFMRFPWMPETGGASAPPPAKPEASSPPDPGPMPEVSSEVEALRQRLEQLESEIVSARKPAKKKSAKKAAKPKTKAKPRR